MAPFFILIFTYPLKKLSLFTKIKVGWEEYFKPERQLCLNAMLKWQRRSQKLEERL